VYKGLGAEERPPIKCEALTSNSSSGEKNLLKEFLELFLYIFKFNLMN
jgi:hypothetical protein